MTKLILAAVAAMLMTPALACDQAQLNLLKDQVRALEKQAASMRQLERIERDRNRMLDRQIRNQR